MTQCDRLLHLLQGGMAVSSLEITSLLAIPNVTGRVSDLRAKGFDVKVERDRAGVFRYRLVDFNPTLGL